MLVHDKTPFPFKERFESLIQSLQDKICGELELLDGINLFREDLWKRKEGGGGRTRVIESGKIIEKGGVNTSIVFGSVPPSLQQSIGISGTKFYACGLSLVLHPKNPYVPTVHANWRYFQLFGIGDKLIDQWIGGGSDLTPYYVFEEDGRHFHQSLKKNLDQFGNFWYPEFKENCDRYFANFHREGEARGIGGIFYDTLRPDIRGMNLEELFLFHQSNANTFLPSYLPIVLRRMNTPYSEREIDWQEFRRGRYVEFNLIHDKGTLFGLKTQGRTESILMSLPPRASWKYDYQPESGSPEAKLMEYLKPRNWI